MAKLSIMGGPLPTKPATGMASPEVKKILGYNPKPNALIDFAKMAGQSILRTAGSVGLEAQNRGLSILSNLGVKEAKPTPEVQIPDYLKPLFGEDKLKDISSRLQTSSEFIKSNPFAQKYGLDKASMPLAFGSIIGLTALDLGGLGGSKNVLSALVKETKPKAVAELLGKMGFDTKVAEKLAPDIALAKTAKEVNSVLDIGKSMHGLSVIADTEKGALRLYDENRNVDLPENLKPIEQEAFGEIHKAGGLSKMVDEYLKTNKNVVNTDEARELFSSYRADRGLSSAVHAPAGVVAREAYERLLKTELGKGSNTVIFTGGGTGAGKSTAVRMFPGMFKDAPIIYDGNLSSFSSATEKIDKALAAGYEASIFYVYREPVDALVGGALPRAERMAVEKGSGRTVPLNEHLNTHFGTPTTAVKLVEKYADNPRVKIQTVDNSLGRGNEQLVPTLDFFRGKVYNRGNAEQIKQAAREALDAEFQGGRISETTYRGSQEISREGRGAGATASGGVQASEIRRDRQTGITPAHTIAELGQGEDGASWSSLIKGFVHGLKPGAKVHVLDYLGTPEFVLEKVGLAKAAEKLQDAKFLARSNLREAISKIQAWKSEVAGIPYSSKNIFRYLDGEARFVKGEMSEVELKVAAEIKEYFKEWAVRLKLPQDGQISEYITHIFEEVPGEGIPRSVFETDPELAALMQKTPAGSVYDPFLQERLGKKGYRQDAWASLDAYVKRGTRKEAMDPALEFLKAEAKTLDDATYNYVTKLTHRINMRPTELDKLVDNFIIQTPGLNRLTRGPRPTMVLTQKIRSMFYRGTLGINLSSALRNLSQGANTYAKLGERFTVVGYAKIFSRLVTRNLDELKEMGILDDELIQDRKIGIYKSMLQKLDPVLFSVFSLAEKINRGAAFYGARSQGLSKGLSEAEAIKYGQRIVRETQFAFGAVDSPVILASDIMKTATQLGTYNIKQIEFLGRMARNREFAGLLRYSLASVGFLYTIGQLFGMTKEQLIPSVGLGGSPAGNLITGLVMLMSDDPQTHAKGVSQLKRAVVSAIPGGAQIRKSVQGIQAFNKGRDTTPTGRTRFDIPQDDATRLQTAIFGKSAIPAAQEYYDSLGKKKEKKQGTRTKLSI